MKKFARIATLWVYNTVYSYVHTKEDAEEVTQDTLIATLKSLKDFQEKSSLKTWVFRIALNKSKDFLKHKKRIKRSGRVISIHEREDGQNIDPAHFNDPGVELESKERMAVLYKGIEQLPENQKKALILAKFDQKSQKEIAEILSITTKAVESLISRAKSNLKQYLEKEGIELWQLFKKKRS